jgi:hypothetical protein
MISLYVFTLLLAIGPTHPEFSDTPWKNVYTDSVVFETFKQCDELAKDVIVKIKPDVKHFVITEIQCREIAVPGKKA